MELQALNLSPPLAVGLILVSCCPGGQVGRSSEILSLTLTSVCVTSVSCGYKVCLQSCSVITQNETEKNISSARMV